jgi:predicted alpha/beta superfamily hydrolase
MRFVFALSAWSLFAGQPFYDRRHDSKVLGESRNYRIFLPPDYEGGSRRYPVIYYFHGHSDRYTLEKYDGGRDTVPKIASWVATHAAIVVAVDGYVARDYTGFYGGSPWDVREEGGDYDFGEYFVELVRHIDGQYRTMTDRRHRGTSGLSMGGFMSLWLSARYPDLIGSASSFNPGPEFYTGDKGRRSLWRPKDHVSSHFHSMIRLIRASGDYISQYHEETHDAYARAPEVHFEYRRDEYHRHWATSIEETFDFHARAFANPALDNIPEQWSYASAYRNFNAWGWRVEAKSDSPGIVYLEDVRQGGLRIRTRRWAPDGPAANMAIHVTSAALYRPGATYRLIDNGAVRPASADREGRLNFEVDGGMHQIGIAGPGTGAQPPVVLPFTTKDKLRVLPRIEVALPVRIYNPRGEPLTGIEVAVSSRYATVRMLRGSASIDKIEPGGVAEANIAAQFTSGNGYLEPARIDIAVTYDGYQQERKYFDLLVIPETVPEPAAIEILDGRTVKLPVFRQKGNQGGGSSLDRTITEGTGNGNGILEPGEEATIWVKMRQGMDPFDKNNWYRAKIYTDSPWIEEAADLQEQKQLEWTGAKERTSLIRLSPKTPGDVRIPLLLDNESWSYRFTPDVRYGVEPLYQAFQLHHRHLHRIEWRAR